MVPSLYQRHSSPTRAKDFMDYKTPAPRSTPMEIPSESALPQQQHVFVAKRHKEVISSPKLRPELNVKDLYSIPDDSMFVLVIPSSIGMEEEGNVHDSRPIASPRTRAQNMSSFLPIRDLQVQAPVFRLRPKPRSSQLLLGFLM
jgi:hypothetical protein